MGIKTVGLAGFGFIGNFLYKRLEDNPDIQVTAVWDPNIEKTSVLKPELICDDLEDLGSRHLDLLVEVAHPDVVKALWPKILTDTNFMIASLTSLADREFYSRISQEACQKERQVYLPHGAVLGLDGLYDGRSLLESVTITTTKHPKSLGLDDSGIVAPRTMFCGSTRDACDRFPRNVNVHAAVALAGMGFDATQSIIIADPGTKTMHHHIEVKGRGLNWNLEIESFSAGKVTGSYTPESLYQSLTSILSGTGAFCIV